MVKNAASENPGFTFNLAKKLPCLYLKSDKRYRKKSQTKVVERIILHKDDITFLFLIKIKLDRSEQKLNEER